MPRPVGIWLVGLVLLAALVPAIAAGRAIADDWMPIGDNGALVLDAHDVFSTDTPLLGVRTSLGGEEYDGRVRHLGPLEAWALAVPERIAGSQPWGIVVGVALIAIAALFAVGWSSARVAGVGATGWALALTTVLGWSLGRQLLADPWNPYIAVLPLVAALFLAWAAGAGDAWALPPLALAASFVVQAHLLYGPLVGVLFVGALIAVVVTRPAVRELVTTAAVLLVAWLFPIWEQISNRGSGNMIELARAYRADDQPAVGWEYAFRAVGRTIGVVPIFARPARELDGFGPALPALTLLTAVLVFAGLVAGLIISIMRRDRVAASAGGVALIALVVTTITTAQVPVAFPDVATYRMLVLWPVSMFTWFALGLLVARLVRVPVVARRIGAALALVVFAVAIPAAAVADSDSIEDQRHMDAVRALSRESEDALEDVGPVLVRATGEVEGQMLYGMVRELRRRGIDARVDRGDVYLDGKYIAPDGAATLYVIGGDTGEAPIPEAELLASYRAWTDDDQARLDELAVEMRALMVATGVPQLADRDPAEPGTDAELLRLAVEGEITLSEADRELINAYDDLRFTIDQLTFAAYLAPAR